MVECPWCGNEIPTEEYTMHYATCSKAPKRPEEAPPEWVRVRPVIKLPQNVCIICGGSHPSWECPIVAEDRRKFVEDLSEFDDLIHLLFYELIIRLEASPLQLQIERLESAWFDISGYAGIKGKVILSINESVGIIDAERVAATLMHEILHQKFPRFSESKIMQLQEQKWKELYQGAPLPL